MGNGQILEKFIAAIAEKNRLGNQTPKLPLFNLSGKEKEDLSVTSTFFVPQFCLFTTPGWLNAQDIAKITGQEVSQNISFGMKKNDSQTYDLTISDSKESKSFQLILDSFDRITFFKQINGGNQIQLEKLEPQSADVVGISSLLNLRTEPVLGNNTNRYWSMQNVSKAIGEVGESMDFEPPQDGSKASSSP